MPNLSRNKYSTRSLDKAGIILSTICVIHCIATPFLIFISPWLAGLFDSKWSHLGIFLTIIPIAYFTFYRFYKYHRNKKPIILGSIGLLLLMSSLLSPGHDWELTSHIHQKHANNHFHYIDTIINILGSVLLIIGHWLNIKIHKSAKSAQECCAHR